MYPDPDLRTPSLFQIQKAVGDVPKINFIFHLDPTLIPRLLGQHYIFLPFLMQFVYWVNTHLHLLNSLRF